MSKSEKYISIVPLNNFDSNVQSIKLNDKICLTHISNGELKKIIDTFQSSRGMLRIALDDVNFVIEMNALTTIEGKPVVIFDHMQPRVQKVILALRLLKSGDVAASCGFLLDENRKASGLASIPKPVRSQNRYLLEQEETDRLVELWKKLQNIEKNKPQLQFPMYYFMKTYDERSNEDKIVDYTTILESIVFHKERKTIEPAGNVIGIAIGMLLGNNNKERIEIKRKFIKAYKIRNAKVHGNIDRLKEYNKKYDVGELAKKIEDHVRCVLRKFVEE